MPNDDNFIKFHEIMVKSLDLHINDIGKHVVATMLWKQYCLTRIVCIRPKGRTQHIFPRSQHSCLYVYIHRPQVNLYQVVVGQQSVRTLFKSLAQLFLLMFFKKWPKITLYRISYHFRPIPQFYFLCEIFVQNGCRRPFWMSENHFRSHFWSFQIDTQINLFLKFLTKWLTSAILDVRNSLSIAFLAISDR